MYHLIHHFFITLVNFVCISFENLHLRSYCLLLVSRQFFYLLRCNVSISSIVLNIFSLLFSVSPPYFPFSTSLFNVSTNPSVFFSCFCFSHLLKWSLSCLLLARRQNNSTFTGAFFEPFAYDQRVYEFLPKTDRVPWDWNPGVDTLAEPFLNIIVNSILPKSWYFYQERYARDLCKRGDISCVLLQNTLCTSNSSCKIPLLKAMTGKRKKSFIPSEHSSSSLLLNTGKEVSIIQTPFPCPPLV